MQNKFALCLGSGLSEPPKIAIWVQNLNIGAIWVENTQIWMLNIKKII